MSNEQEHVARILAETREEVTRADTKASIVLALAGVVTGAVLAGMIAGQFTFKSAGLVGGSFVGLGGLLLLAGVAWLGYAVYPNIGTPEAGRARYFEEIVQYQAWDDKALREALQTDSDGDRLKQQLFVLSVIVSNKYKRTKIGMGLTAAGVLLVVIGFVISTQLKACP